MNKSTVLVCMLFVAIGLTLTFLLWEDVTVAMCPPLPTQQHNRTISTSPHLGFNNSPCHPPDPIVVIQNNTVYQTCYNETVYVQQNFTIYKNHTVYQNITITKNNTIVKTNTEYVYMTEPEDCKPWRQRGFWVADRLLYLTYNHSCQLLPIAMNFPMDFFQNGSLQLYPTDDTTKWFNGHYPLGIPHTPEKYKYFDTNENTFVPPEWPQNFNITNYVFGNSSFFGNFGSGGGFGDYEFLRGKVVIMLGDSLDLITLTGLCGQFGKDVTRQSVMPMQKPELANRPMPEHLLYPLVFCKNEKLDFHVIKIHHFGVFQTVYPSNYPAAPDTRYVIEKRFPYALEQINKTMKDVLLIQIYSSLWDLHTKRDNPYELKKRWIPSWIKLMEEMMIEPTLKLVNASLPKSANRPKIVLRTAPPPKTWRDFDKIHVQELNEATEWLADKWQKELMLIDWAYILKGRADWCWDAHHYSAETELNKWNIFLNILYYYHKKSLNQTVDLPSLQAHNKNNIVDDFDDDEFDESDKRK